MEVPHRSTTSFRDAIAVKSLDTHTYGANISQDHCYGLVAHGGFLISVIISAVQQHFRSTLQTYNQPDTFELSAVFLRSAGTGKAVVVLRDSKLGTSLSTVHFALLQNDKERVVGYASNANLALVTGLSYQNPSPLAPFPKSIDLRKAAAQGADAHWIGYTIPYRSDSLIKPLTHFQLFMPTDTSSSHKHIADFWVRLRSRKEGLTTEMLGAVVDNWHGMLENYVAESPWNALQLVASAARAVSAGTPLSDKDISTPSFVYSTSSLHLEIKKALPREGVEWLFMRAQVTEIKSGRLDATVYICNEKLELVALSHQVIFIFNRARTAGEEGQDSRKSKI